MQPASAGRFNVLPLVDDRDLKIEDYCPNEAKRQLGVALDDVFWPNVDQFDLQTAT